MNLSIVVALAALSSASAFVPAAQSGPQTSLYAEADRRSFVAAAGASIFAAAVPSIANAGTMGQERVSDPTEV
jgi:hypothetical protein